MNEFAETESVRLPNREEVLLHPDYQDDTKPLPNRENLLDITLEEELIAARAKLQNKG